MFHALTTSLTALTLLAHSILGCCWHAHAVAGPEAMSVAGESIAAVMPDSGCGSHCGHHRSSQSAPDGSELPPASDHPAPSCDHGECAFVTARSAAWDLLQVTAPPVPAAIAAGTSLTGVNGGLCVALASLDGPMLTTEGRARACLQVWVL